MARTLHCIPVSLALVFLWDAGFAAPRRPLVRSILTSQGTQPGLTHTILSPGDCSGCHRGYDGANNIEPWDTWAGSMMAQASRDPIFWAALDVANHDIPGVGEFCLRCHVPTGWLAGRSEPPGGDTAGCGFQGKMDELNKDLEGVSCHVCHRMMVNPSPPPGEDPVYYENAQFWIDDSDCDGMGEPCRRGPYSYPQDGAVPPPHAWALSQYHEDSDNCGNCHNVTNPVKTLIHNGVDTGIPMPIERTYSEWAQSDYGDPLSAQYRTCQNCHMPDATVIPAYACTDRQNNHSGDMPVHQFAGGNAWVPDVLRQEYPALNLGPNLTAARNWALNMLQNASALVEVTAPDSVAAGGTLLVGVKVTNLTGHKLPTGYPEGRRMWLNLQVRDGLNNLVWESGAYNPATAVLTRDNQIKVYEVKPGVYNRNGTGECDVTDGASNPIFHFVLNDCYALDNRIPPLGFAGKDDPETRPVNYTYPETSPGSGILVNYDVTSYAVPVAANTPSPLSVSATLRYQTMSREYADFLLDQAVTNSFPDDCIERSTGFPTQSRGEILHQMWTTYDRCPPVDMDTGAATVTVFSGPTGVGGGPPAQRALSLDQNYPNPVAPGAYETRIAFHLPGDGHVRLEIFDVRGKRVRTLLDGFEAAGPNSVAWDRRDDAGRTVASGVYLYRLTAGGAVLAKRMVLMR